MKPHEKCGQTKPGIISCIITSTFHNQAACVLVIRPWANILDVHKRHTVHDQELINRPFNSSEMNTRRSLVSHRLTVSPLQSLRSPTPARFVVRRHRVSVRDAHLCPWSTLFPTRRRSSGGLARCPRSISSAPCRAPTRKPGDTWRWNVLRDAENNNGSLSQPVTRLRPPATLSIFVRAFRAPRREDGGEDAGRMRSGDKAERTEETPTDTQDDAQIPQNTQPSGASTKQVWLLTTM